MTQFLTSPEFLACSTMQRQWLRTLVESGFNYELAHTTAFTHLTPQRALLYGYAVRWQPHVAAALQVYLGTTEADVLKAERQASVRHLLIKVRFQLRHVEVGSIAAQRFLAQEERLLLGGRTRLEDAGDDEPAAKISKPQAPAPASPAPSTDAPEKIRYHVGQIITDRDEQGVVHSARVLTVTADGDWDDIEELPL